MVILAFDNIAKSYGDTPALRGVSFDVHAGEIFGLLGPNGAGKSTLIRILMDIIRADSGEVRVFGERRQREHLDRLGYLPEERGLYTKLTVVDVMTYFGALKGLHRAEARRRSAEWLERVELPHVAGWKIDRLSKGMSQKVQIAAVLLSDPELCVLDEPTTGLDPVNVRLVQDLLIERRRNGRTTILSTHQMNQVEALCDRDRDDQSRPVDGLRCGRRGATSAFAPRGPRPRARSAPVGSSRGERNRRWGRIVAIDAGRRQRPLGCVDDSRRRGCHYRPVRADARAHGRHLSSDRPRRAGVSMTRMRGWRKTWTIATFEFLTAVRRPGYLITTFGMPLFMAAYGGRCRDPGVLCQPERP